MRLHMIGLVLGVVSMSVSPAGAQNQPGQIRTTPGVPMRTGFTQPVRTTAGNLFGVIPGGGQTINGSYFPAYYTTGTSLSINGDGFSVSLNGGLANQLGFTTLNGNYYGGYSHGQSTCIAVQDAGAVLGNLPAYIRDHSTVLLGADYGWDYDVICLPGYGGYSYPGGYRYGYGSGWYPPGYTYYRSGQAVANPTYGWGQLGQPNTQQAPSQQSAQPAEPPEPLEIARVALVLGNLESAEEQYRKHLIEHPDDSDALREFALVMLDAERPEEGFAAMRKAYRDKPELASDRLDLRQYGFDGSRTRRLMGKISPTANRINSSSGWLALTVVLQGQGKDRAAVRMLAKAQAVGLETEIVTALQASLKH